MPLPVSTTGRAARPARGCLPRISKAGSWLSLLGAGGCWLLAFLFLTIGWLALESQLDWMAPHMWAAEDADNVGDGIILFLLEFILRGLFLLGSAVLVFLGMLVPAALASVLHLVGIVSSFGGLITSKSGGLSRLGSIPPLLLHVGGAAGALLWVAYWLASVVAGDAPPAG